MEIATEKKLKIAIQGYEGSFHQLAAEKYYGQSVEVVPARSFTEMVSITSSPEQCTEGVMAIENSIAGSILSNYKLLEDAKLHITGEVYLPIAQHLMAMPGTDINQLKEIHSHPMALLQCKKFLNQWPSIRLVETEDTALSAQKIKEQQLYGTGAIASELAARLHGLEIVERHVETVRNNYTRFLVLSRSASENWDDFNKCSIHFSLKHDPGSLATALTAIARLNGNLSKIQSVPIIEKEWQYSFHADIEFENKAQYEAIIEELETKTSELHILGTYKNGRK